MYLIRETEESFERLDGALLWVLEYGNLNVKAELQHPSDFLWSLNGYHIEVRPLEGK